MKKKELEPEGLKWGLLLKNRCPQCRKDLLNSLSTVRGVLSHGCGFKISEQRFKEITADMTSRNIEHFS